jgi:two-component system chemotaxis response regulator CheY
VAEDGLKRVLVIDDAALVRAFYRAALESAGFAVEEALNGIEALETLAAKDFDLLIVDVNMPRMDGLTFLHALRRRDDAAAGVPALVTSTEAGRQDMEAACRAGASHYLVKPLTQEVLAHYAVLLSGAPA